MRLRLGPRTKPARPARPPPRPKRKRKGSPADARAILVADQREARERLATRADKFWKTAGPVERAAYFARVRAALLEEGFRPTPMQWRHRGHAFGLIKNLGRDKQIHVRVYDNGIVDAELEIHRRYLEHLISPRPSAHKIVGRLFRKHGIPTHLLNEKYLPRVGAQRLRYPKGRTRVAHVLGAAGVVGGLVAVSVARLTIGRRGRAD